MAIQWSTAVRNARLDSIETTIGTAPHLCMFTGAPPANCGTAFTGTKLVDITLASDWAGAASNGTKAVTVGGGISTTALAAGTMGYYRFYDSTGTNGVCHEQGTITATGGGGDMTVDNPTVTNGQTINVTAFTKTEPGA